MVEILANEHPEVYFMPINQYFFDNFNITENTTRLQNKYYLDYTDKYNEETKKNDSILVEFSPNYNDLELIFDDNNIVYTKKLATGFQKYRIISSSSENIFFNVSNRNNRKNANYLLRYYYSEEDREYNYILDYNYKMENKSSNVPDDFTLELIFNKIDILRNNTHLFPSSDERITFEIYASLFQKSDDDEEFLNSSALIYKKPSYVNKTLHKYNEEDTFCLIFKNIPKNINSILELRLGINVIIEQNIFNEEFLAYTLEVDLNYKDKENNGDNDLVIIISITVSVVVFVGLIIFSIICFFRIRKLKKNNSELQEKVLSTKFAAGREENVLIKEEKTKRDLDYETTFI